MAPGRSYDDDEVRSIIARALGTQAGGNAGTELSHEQLLAVGSEIGLSAEAMEQAARDVEQSGAIARLERRILGRRRSWFASHAAAFGVVNSVLFAINYLTTPGQWWVLFPLVVWGLVLLLHARFGLSRAVSRRALARESERLNREREPFGLVSSPEARLRVSEEAPRSDATSSEEAPIDAEKPAIDARSG